MRRGEDRLVLGKAGLYGCQWADQVDDLSHDPDSALPRHPRLVRNPVDVEALEYEANLLAEEIGAVIQDSKPLNAILALSECIGRYAALAARGDDRELAATFEIFRLAAGESARREHDKMRLRLVQTAFGRKPKTIDDRGAIRDAIDRRT